MRFILDALELSSEFKALLESVKANQLPASATGLSNVHKAAVISGLVEAADKPALIIAPDEWEGEKLAADLSSMLQCHVPVFPAKEYVFYDVEGASREWTIQRMNVLSLLAGQGLRAVVTTADAVCQYTLPPETLKSAIFELKPGLNIDIEALCARLANLGYTRCSLVEGAGQFARRGGILDIFPSSADSPVRIEFWGEEIDTIASFDILTQRRIENIKSVQIPPVSETVLLGDAAERLKNRLLQLKDSLKSSRKESTKRFVQRISEDLERLDNGLPIISIDRYAEAIYNATFLDYMPSAMVFVSDTQKIKEKLTAFSWQLHEDIKSLLEQGRIYGELCNLAMDSAAFWQLMHSRGVIYLDTFAPGSVETPLKQLCAFKVKLLGGAAGNLDILTEEITSYQSRGFSCAIAAHDATRAENLRQILQERGINAALLGRNDPLPAKGSAAVYDVSLSSGFELTAERVAVIDAGGKRDAEVKKSRYKSKKGEKISTFADLKIGDYVVHVNYGIGQYMGIHRLTVEGVAKDYIKIKYAGEDTLYVPANQLDLIAKYVGASDGNVKLSRMGSGEWSRAKSKVKSAVKDMAKQLIELYAARQRIKGFAFSPDNEWQREFEDAFEYVETDDQRKCTIEIKADMEKNVPMDRLLCGDVGFGKTEVALRAAFKCVQDSKQVAFLVPTTILSWQHYQTILSRMARFPIKVEVLNRFRSPKQQKEILKKLKRGELDILVGTHRILQKDVEFKDLGLVIVDEEQRFGVSHKEKLKQMTKNVDVLTLSATPIPRTLNMALTGIRDMSILEEAPSDRYPVQTYVLEHDWDIIAEAMKKELRRGGQVFYLHNRIESIDKVAARISELLPNARVGVAHGQLSEDELSNVWQAMVSGEIDILVCTTIIETGVDLPNANTLIIEDADRLGLAQLHQIRGRVGRSQRRAFAYFTYKRGKSLTEVAEKRLTAIREFTEFGSGFKIAMRDLEIRGAGNILGAEQSGHMQSVGYDMYLRILSEVVLEEKGEAPEKVECAVDVMIDAYIPENYIENEETRIDIYKKIAFVADNADKEDLLDELIDRFGDIPKPVENLIEISLVRNLASKLGFYEISQKSGVLMLFPKTFDKQRLPLLAAAFKGRMLISAGQKPCISLKVGQSRDILPVLKEILGKYNEILSETAAPPAT